MQLRGEFRWANGLVIPNNLTAFGSQQVLKRAIQGDSDFDFWVALCQGVYVPDLQVDGLDEPTIGVNGYERIHLAQDDTDWPTFGQVNGEWFVETKELIWAATIGDFDKSITRMAIVGSETDLTGEVFCLSGALAEPLLITPGTDEDDRKFRYRLYAH